MILVTGAGGNNGRELIQRLSSLGVAVRGMIHRQPDPANPKWSGVEFVVADFDDPASIRRALKGVERAFLVTNSSERAEAQQLAFVEAAREAGLRHIVYLSQLHAAPDSPVRFLRYHAAVEHKIAASGMAYTFLRPKPLHAGSSGISLDHSVPRPVLCARGWLACEPCRCPRYRLRRRGRAHRRRTRR